MPQGGQKPLNVWAQVAYYTGLGFILPAGAVAGYIIGWLLDRGLHTAPWLSLAGAFGGVAAGFVEILQLLGRAEKQQDGSGNDSSDGSGAS